MSSLVVVCSRSYAFILLLTTNDMLHQLLREDRQHRLACMSTNHRHVDGLHVRPRDFVHELVGPHHIQRRYTHDLPWVQALLLVEPKAYIRIYICVSSYLTYIYISIYSTYICSSVAPPPPPPWATIHF